MITLIALIISIIGGLNWLLVGIASFDFVAFIFGGVGTVFARIIYILVGIAALWLIYFIIRRKAKFSDIG